MLHLSLYTFTPLHLHLYFTPLLYTVTLHFYFPPLFYTFTLTPLLYTFTFTPLPYVFQPHVTEVEKHLFSPFVPRVIGANEFEIITKDDSPICLGSGSFGVVLLARDITQGSLVVIKIFKNSM